MADPNNVEGNAVVECETTDGAEGKTDSARTSTTSRPLVRDSAKRARKRMVEWSKVLTAPPPRRMLRIAELPWNIWIT